MASGFISRGFRGRRRDPAPSGRISPGQYLIRDFPVLSAGPTPHSPLATWSFSIVGYEPRNRARNAGPAWAWSHMAAR